MKDDKKGPWKKSSRTKKHENTLGIKVMMVMFQKIITLINNYISKANSRKCHILNILLHPGSFIIYDIFYY